MEWLWRFLRIDQDTLRELRIDEYRRQMVEAENVGERMHAWRCMVKEIKNRSEAQIERMERERGLVGR